MKHLSQQHVGHRVPFFKENKSITNKFINITELC